MYILKIFLELIKSKDLLVDDMGRSEPPRQGPDLRVSSTSKSFDLISFRKIK